MLTCVKAARDAADVLFPSLLVFSRQHKVPVFQNAGTKGK